VSAVDRPPPLQALSLDRLRERSQVRAVQVEHRYPQAQAFLVAHGHQGVAVLHALLQDAAIDDGVLVASGSSRTLAARTELLSKDTVHRHLLNPQRAGVLTRVPSIDHPTPAYVVHLDGIGISVTFPDPP